MTTFEEFGLSGELIGSIRAMEISEPTEIQRKSIPHIIAGRDLIGESATGSGKTLAFGCAIVENVRPGLGLQALVLTPTRELAEQVKESLRQLSHHKQLKIMPVYGGVSIEPQIQYLPRAEVVVATPGRLLDHIERKTIDVSKIKILVLDEADRMFDMGFIDDVEAIISKCPKKRQTLFFSATMQTYVRGMADRHMVNPVTTSAEKHVDPSKLKQVYYDVQRNMKLSLLAHLLEHEKSGLVMVFCNTKRTTDFVTKNLKANRIDAIAIHGGLSQNKRNRTMEAFNGAKAHVLVCTDVAARGLHIENVSHVYNYEIPKNAKDYVHRIGRTARAGEEGKAVNIIADYDYDNFSRVISEYRDFSIEKAEKPFVKMLAAISRPENMGRRSPRARPRWESEGREGHARHNTDGMQQRPRQRPQHRRWR